MEIISCFEPKRAAYASCSALSIEDLLNSQQHGRRFGFSVRREIRTAISHTKKNAQALTSAIMQTRTFFAFFFILLCCGVLSVQLLTFVYGFAAPLNLLSAERTDVSILGGKMRNFALNSGSEEFDGNGNVSLIDRAEEAALFKLPVSYTRYTVQPGDSISSITKRFGLKNISTLIGLNDIANVRLLRAGQELRVPSIDGLLYTVRAGDNLALIAETHGVGVEEILDVNELTSDVLLKGDTLFIPGVRLDSAVLKKALGELFAAPLGVKWRISSPYGWRADPFTGVRSFHTGVDLVVPHGTPIKASMGGTVAAAGYSNVYGNYVIINHGNGYQTLYAHMSSFSVKRGQQVEQSTRIGYVGSTGYSTGAHLHFSVYKDGKLINPVQVLKF